MKSFRLINKGKFEIKDFDMRKSEKSPAYTGLFDRLIISKI